MDRLLLEALALTASDLGLSLLVVGVLVVVGFLLRSIAKLEAEFAAADPAPEPEPRSQDFDWPARAKGPVAEAHFGRERLAHEPPTSHREAA